jgi:hypothetical protein
MINGREDFDLPYTTAQLPLFRMLGTRSADKRHAVILDWLDRYLGQVGE